MPTYDYQCKTCGKAFEWFQSMSADKLAECPVEVCEQEVKGKGVVERKIGKGAGLIFNGSGFYLTDYTKTSGSSSGTSSGAASGTSSDSSGTTSGTSPSSSTSTPSSPDK